MLDQLLVIVSVTFIVMLSPGPDMVLVLRNTFVGGRRAGLQTSMGILLGNLVHIPTVCSASGSSSRKASWLFPRSSMQRLYISSTLGS